MCDDRVAICVKYEPIYDGVYIGLLLYGSQGWFPGNKQVSHKAKTTELKQLLPGDNMTRCSTFRDWKTDFVIAGTAAEQHCVRSLSETPLSPCKRSNTLWPETDGLEGKIHELVLIANSNSKRFGSKNTTLLPLGKSIWLMWLWEELTCVLSQEKSVVCSCLKTWIVPFLHSSAYAQWRGFSPELRRCGPQSDEPATTAQHRPG